MLSSFSFMAITLSESDAAIWRLWAALAADFDGSAGLEEIPFDVVEPSDFSR